MMKMSNYMHEFNLSFETFMFSDDMHFKEENDHASHPYSRESTATTSACGLTYCSHVLWRVYMPLGGGGGGSTVTAIWR